MAIEAPEDPGRNLVTSSEEVGDLLRVVERLNAIRDADELVDAVAREAAVLADYECALLSLALPEGAIVGTWNLPEEDRRRFRERARTSDIAYRRKKRDHIRQFVFPGTRIAFVPAGSDLPAAPLTEEPAPRTTGTGDWNPDDRLFLLVTGAGGEEIGICSLDRPADGRRPRAEALWRLHFAERLLAIGGSLLQMRLYERGLRRSEASLRTLIEDAPVGIYRRTRDGRLLSVNDRLAAIFGWSSPGAVLDDPEALARIEPADVTERLDALSDGGEVAGLDVTGMRNDGEPVRLKLTARRLPQRDVTLGIVEDVTREARLADQLQRVRRLEAVATLASGVAHDFNNILAGILGYAGLLKDAEGLDDRERRAVEIIDEAASRGADLTRQLLGVASDPSTDRRVVDIRVLLDEVSRMAQETFDRRIDLVVEAPDELPGVTGNASDLHRVVLNLAINARDATGGRGRIVLRAVEDPEGPVSPAVIVPTETWVRVEVEDDGEGMSEDVRRRLFEPFFTTKERGKGTGLGLYLVYATMQAHGGLVDVESEPGGGTIIRLWLPSSGALPRRDADAEDEVLPVPRARPRGRVLFVEDEEMLRDLAEQVLAEDGWEVVLAPDGERAVALLEAPGVSFDLAVLDLVMPGLNGIEVYRILRARHPDLPVVLSSGNAENTHIDREVERGIATLLPKPYRPSDLVRVLDGVYEATRG